ncbi:MAG: hypothetical protein AAF125_17205 [Chloroflexota bacterium]
MTAQTFLIEPFDIMLHATEEGVNTLQARFATWLRTLNSPARFVCWQMPATLNDKINQINWQVREVDDRERVSLLTGYRRHYETLQDNAEYQRSLCGMAVWSDANPRALAGGMTSAFDTPVFAGAWPQLFDGRYVLQKAPFWHLAPVGRPGGRPLWAVLNSYAFAPSGWNFFRPLPPLLRLNFPLALAVDIPKTYERNAGIDALEGIIQAYQVHLAGVSGEDSRSVQRVADCRRALGEINNGDSSSPTSCLRLNHAFVSEITVSIRSRSVVRSSAATATLTLTVCSASPLLISPSARRQSATR